MDYELRVSPRVEEQIEQTIRYVTYGLGSPQAAKAILDDVEKAYGQLRAAACSFSLCSDPYLSARGYRKMGLERHRYVIIYRCEGNVVYIVGFFHMLENYRDKI